MSTCEALIGVPDGTESTCGRPDAVWTASACVHEHVAHQYTCQQCMDRESFCEPCYCLDGHRCPVVIREVVRR